MKSYGGRHDDINVLLLHCKENLYLKRLLRSCVCVSVSVFREKERVQAQYFFQIN